jgi:hypothetical protein
MEKNWKQKTGLYCSYFFFFYMTAFFSAVTVKSCVDYYAPEMIPLKVINPRIYDGFGPFLGPVAILLSAHSSFIWLFGIFFYMIVLELISEKLAQFVDELKEVGWGFLRGSRLYLKLIMWCKIEVKFLNFISCQVYT